MRKEELIKFFRGNSKLFLLAAIGIIIFHKYMPVVICFLIFAALGIFTIKISRAVPHISIETVTPSAILMGYAFGWKVGLVFGILVGFIGYIRASQVNLTIIICSLLMGLVGVLADMFKGMGMAFWVAYLLAYFIRANLSFFLISKINSNFVENIMHSYIESLYNMVVVIHFMTLFYGVMQNFV
jgi:hypothetical protein